MPDKDPVEDVLHGAKDQQTVTPEGIRVGPSIDGVRLRPAVTHVDDRGEVCEIFDPRWGIDPSAMVYAYQATIRPGKIKGWIVHRLQEDRIFAAGDTCAGCSMTRGPSRRPTAGCKRST